MQYYVFNTQIMEQSYAFKYKFYDRKDLCYSINEVLQGNNNIKYGDINNWDVSAITDMSKLFSNMPTFNINISNWDVSNVNDMLMTCQ